MYSCVFCGTTTHHPRDVRERYCARCHVFASDVLEIFEGGLAYNQSQHPTLADGRPAPDEIIVPRDTFERAIGALVRSRQWPGHVPMVTVPTWLAENIRATIREALKNVTRG